MKVLKFGGSSVAKPERIQHIGQLLKSRLSNGEQLAVVFSAFGGITDTLISMASLAEKGDDSYLKTLGEYIERHNTALDQLVDSQDKDELQKALTDNHETLEDLLKGVLLVREASPRTMDYILSFGERNSNFIISSHLNSIGLKTEYLDARKIIKTNKEFGAAKVDFAITEQRINDYFKEHNGHTQIVTGFISSDVGGLTTTLGRGGSDYTAAILAGALDAEVLEIWTDVDGVLTCDPRKVKKAYTIQNLSYNEAMELSHFGAKVIYPPTIQPALKKNIPIYIRNTFNPTFIGTKIGKIVSEEKVARIKGLSSMSGVSLLTLEGPGLMGSKGIAARFFAALARADVNIIMITQGSSEHAISVAIKRDKLKSAMHAAETEFKAEMKNSLVHDVRVDDNLSILAIVGENMRHIPGVAGRLFSSLGQNGVNVAAIAQGSSELNISFAIESKDETKALNLIHDSFFLSNLKTVNVFMVGVGLIGSTLLRQIEDQKNYLEKNQKLQINIVGLANSKKMLFNSDGITHDQWKETLMAKGQDMNISDFISTMKDMNLANSVFIDNTANKNIPNYYEQILKSSISISTPNKVATSSSYESYLNLNNLAKERNVQFMYETNVGAGLPILSTIETLRNSGDKIEKIEAVLSGSISFIFNNFSSERPFSAMVAEAKAKGYTEPDPREDLSGMDIRRKITILVRESGFAIEPEQVQLQNLLSQEALNAPSIDAFFDALKKEDSKFQRLAQDAEKKGKVLRYIAKYMDGKASVVLEEVDVASPFYGLQGSDNMVVFTTSRYSARPLVIKGPGAGAEVTAAGVFSDIISIGNKNHIGYKA